MNSKQRLSDNEKSVILDAVESIWRDSERVAIAAYGSRVAGYAREDSDYDVIVVLDKYRPKVGYKYIDKEMDIATLVVDRRSLINDAEKASLGEFVVGRLLNVYEPLEGADYLQDVERRYKKRIINETLNEIIAAYKDFSSELLIPPEYFVFEKARKRASVYPPVLYSIVKTYFGNGKEENLRNSLSQFEYPLRELEREDVISFQEGSVRIERSHIRSSPLYRFTAGEDAFRSVRSYVAHGYAGRDVLEVAGNELLSKIKRSREIGEIPNQIRNPEILWQIDEGLLIVDSFWVEKTARHLGLTRDVKVTEKHLGSLTSVASLYILDDKTKSKKIVVKNFRDVKSTKWVMAGLLTLFTKPFSIAPLARLQREYDSIRKLRKFGLDTPKVISVCLNERILVTEFIEGTDLGEIIKNILKDESVDISPITLYGETLSLAHKTGYTLGDTKPSNAILSHNKLFLVDLEQVSEGGEKGWDIAEFLYYGAKLTLNTYGVKRVTSGFLDGYLEEGEKEHLREALDMKYLAPFTPLVSLDVAKAIRDEIKSRIC